MGKSRERREGQEWGQKDRGREYEESMEKRMGMEEKESGRETREATSS